MIPWDVLSNTEDEQLFMFQPVEGGALVELSDHSVDEEGAHVSL